MRHLLAIAIVVALSLGALPANAAGQCEFKLGFKALADQIPEIVGQCVENERWNTSNGDSLQQTTRGLMVWRKSDNFTAFTDGYRSWVNGPYGLQQRLNTEQFVWESASARNDARQIVLNVTDLGAGWTRKLETSGTQSNFIASSTFAWVGPGGYSPDGIYQISCWVSVSDNPATAMDMLNRRTVSPGFRAVIPPIVGENRIAQVRADDSVESSVLFSATYRNVFMSVIVHGATGRATPSQVSNLLQLMIRRIAG